MFIFCVVLNVFFICPSAQSSRLDFVHHIETFVLMKMPKEAERCESQPGSGRKSVFIATSHQHVTVCSKNSLHFCLFGFNVHFCQLWIRVTPWDYKMGLVITKTLNLQTDLLFKALLSTTAPVGYLLNAEGSIPPTDTHNLLLLVDCASAVHVFLLILRCGWDAASDFSQRLTEECQCSGKENHLLELSTFFYRPTCRILMSEKHLQMSAAARADVVFSSVCFCLPGEVCENWLRLLDHRLLSLLFLYGKNISHLTH